jgi:hypothetical protein
MWRLSVADGGCVCANNLSSADSLKEPRCAAAAPGLPVHLVGEYVSYINLADLPPDGSEVNEA